MVSIKRSLWVVMTVLLCAGAIGQAVPQGAGGTAKAFRYEVVSVREVKGDPKSISFESLPDGFQMKGLTLQSLIPDAYGISQRDLVSGWPRWATSVRFDIDAKMDMETADALRRLSTKQQDVERQLMMQALLEDRFKLRVRRGSEVRTTYELVLAKGGAKMKEDNPATDRDGNPWQEGVRPSTDWLVEDGRISGHAMPVAVLADHLQGPVGSTILDRTGLTGRYDVMLQWDSKYEAASNSTEPSIYAAVEEQLGLRLKPAKTTVKTIVIDRLEMPSEN